MRAILAILILGLYSCQTPLTLADDTKLQEIFTASEIEELSELVSDFDNLVLRITGSTEVENGYVTLSKELNYSSDETDWKQLDEELTVFAQAKLIELKDKSVFNDIWYLNGSYSGPEHDLQVTLTPKAFDSRYEKFLDRCISQDRQLKHYKDQVQKAGHISLGLFYGFPLAIQDLKLEKESIRLLIAFHFIFARSQQPYDREIHGEVQFLKLRDSDGKSIFEQFFGEPTDEEEKKK